MTYDIIIIGAGSGGLNIASFMNRAGFKVLLIDKTDKSIGGDCLNYGCVPSKALIHAARMVKSATESKQFGIATKGKADMKKVSQYINSKKEIIRKHENAGYFRKKGMDVVLGKASFSGPNSVKVNGKEYSGKKILIATGSRPRELPGASKYYTNETIFDIKKLPKHLVIVGGGPIGIELGQAFRFLGSEVSIIVRDSKILPKEDSTIALILQKKLEKDGIKFYFKSEVKKFIGSTKLSIGKKIITYDALLVSIGRRLNIEGLELENAGIEFSGGRIVVDNYLRTTNKDVYVCGDVAGSYQFTHVAELHASVLINNFFSPIKKKVDYSKLNWVTYTTPEIATFGLNEKELANRNIEYRKLSHEFKDDDRSIVDDWTNGKLILYVSKTKILGGTMIANNAGELFQELVLAQSSGLDIKELFGKIYAYPTASRVNKKIISNLFAERLTPMTKRLFKVLYR